MPKIAIKCEGIVMSINQTKIEPAIQLLNEVGVVASLRFQK